LYQNFNKARGPSKNCKYNIVFIYNGRIDRKKISIKEKNLLDINKGILYIKARENEIGSDENKISLIYKIFNDLNITNEKKKTVCKMQNGSLEEI